MQELCFAEYEGAWVKPQPPPPQLLARYAGAVPRYTSYPTTAQFTAQADDAAHRAWLSEIEPGRPVALYLHIPFSERLRWYCGSHAAVPTSHGPVQSYVAALLHEIDLVAEALPARLEVSAVHFGGGAPNMLAPGDLAAIIGELRERFDVLRGAEIAAELDPSSLTPAWLAAARALGLNRASLGVQDFDPIVQAAVNRNQSFECVASCVGWLRDVGVRSINFDLIFGMPHQTMSRWLTTVMQAASLAPDQVALFGYTHAAWTKPARRLPAEKALATAEERFAQVQAAGGQLDLMGYARIGLDHFARERDNLAIAGADKRVRRNFQGYTTDDAETLIGFGASSISKLPDGYAQNHASLPAWRACIENGRLPTGRGIAFSEDDRVRGAVIDDLMCKLGVNLHEVAARFMRRRLDLLDDRSRSHLSAMEEDGLVQVTRDASGPVALAVTEAGRPFLRNVCALFDAYVRGLVAAV